NPERWSPLWWGPAHRRRLFAALGEISSAVVLRSDMQTAIDDDMRTGAAARGIGAEKQNRIRDLVGRQPSPEWDLLGHGGPALRVDLGIHLRRHDRSRQHCIDADFVARQLERRMPRQTE